ncbi:histidine phosphatase family protein [Lactococcus piscium]|uniref:histidine phosphatase family protein n=1 Tax=Pseudolactococcus carnosus TaxID=2749961 RepID=UPI001FBAF1E2|nr:histidine phosphatase family protein [Lactococcus carnosus]MCJ1995198.1 histidine phosphatase family protein [Lactococcus carnosus]
MVNVYLVRHGKTMFNTIGRAQGWSDTPLTRDGERGVTELGLGFAAKDIKFDLAFSSDSGRTIQTIGFILKYSENEGIPYEMDKRIREWCFGSLDGGFDGELFDGVLPRTDAYKDKSEASLTYEDMANGILEVDTAGWAEPWHVLSKRILDGFFDAAKKAEAEGAQNIVIVSHGLTIATFIKLIDSRQPRFQGLDNGSVTHLTYSDGNFTIGKIGDMSYRALGQEILDAQ